MGIKHLWARLWMMFAGTGPAGRTATRMASAFMPPYYGRLQLARLNPRGYIAPSARVHHDNLIMGPDIFIGERVVIYKDIEGGPVVLGKGVHLYGDTVIQTGMNGSVSIGADTHIQPRCQMSAYLSSIQIGRYVQIAPGCAFYPYNHGFALGEHIWKQPLHTKGGIIVDDDAWLGYGVIVLDGVRIGKGAVVGAGAVVKNDVPDNAVAAGVPARVIKMRTDMKRS